MLARDRTPSAFSYYLRLNRVKEHFEQDLSASLTLETAASIAGLEKKYFSTFFHSKTGICFKDWVTRTRIAKAMDLVQAQDVPITNLAYAVGFRDLRTFERAFKRYTGMTPRAYKTKVSPDANGGP